MKASEFAKLYDLRIVRDDHFDADIGYGNKWMRYKLIRVGKKDKRFILIKDFYLENALKQYPLFDEIRNSLLLTYDLIGIPKNENLSKGEKFMYELKGRFEEAYAYFEKNKIESPLKQLTGIIIGKEKLEDDISDNMSYDSEVIIDRWLNHHDANFQMKVVNALGLNKRESLVRILARAVDRLEPSVITIEDINRIDKMLSAKWNIDRLKQHLMALLEAANMTDAISKENARIEDHPDEDLSDEMLYDSVQDYDEEDDGDEATDSEVA